MLLESAEILDTNPSPQKKKQGGLTTIHSNNFTKATFFLALKLRFRDKHKADPSPASTTINKAKTGHLYET